MNGTVCCGAGKVTSYSHFYTEPSLICIYHKQEPFKQSSSFLNIFVVESHKIAICPVAFFYINYAEESVFCALILICPVCLQKLPYFYFSGYSGRCLVGSLVNAVYRLYHKSNSSFLLSEEEGPNIVSLGPNNSYGKGAHPQVFGIKLSENIKHWCVKFSSYLVCQDWESLPSAKSLMVSQLGFPLDLRARMVHLEHLAMSCVLRIFYIRKSHGSLVNSEIQGWKKQKSRSQG